MELFFDEWHSLYESKSGERGIFSRIAAKKHIESHCSNRNADGEWGCNPCSEILLRPCQFCMLMIIQILHVVIRQFDRGCCSSKR